MYTTALLTTLFVKTVFERFYHQKLIYRNNHLGGPDAVLAACAYIVKDAMSDTVAKTITPKGRDVWESLYHYTNKSRYRRTRKYKRNAFGF